MKQYISYFLLFFCFSFTSSAQEQDSLKNIKPGYLLSISPLALADVFDGSSIRLNIEAPVFKNITFGIESGIYNGLAIYKEKTRGYLIKPVLKYYFKNLNGKMHYIGLEYMYKDQKYNLTDSLAIDGTHIEKTYGMSRISNSVSLKYGQISSIGSRFFLEWYAGLGMRFTTSISTLTPEEEDSVLTGLDETNNVDHGDSIIKQAARESGKMTYPNLVIGIKIGYRIN